MLRSPSDSTTPGTELMSAMAVPGLICPFSATDLSDTSTSNTPLRATPHALRSSCESIAFRVRRPSASQLETFVSNSTHPGNLSQEPHQPSVHEVWIVLPRVVPGIRHDNEFPAVALGPFRCA